jgi:anti-anti-sigma factor
VNSWKGDSRVPGRTAHSASDGGLRCRTTQHTGWTLLVLDGELDFTHIDTARKALQSLVVARRGRLALDLRGLTFMDTTGVRLILQALQRAEEQGADFALIRGPFEVHHVLELVGLTEQLRIVDELSALDPPHAPLPLLSAAPRMPAPMSPAAPPRRDIVQAVGDTPLVELQHLSPNPDVRLWAKLESLNPTGSAMDRVARAMLEDAEARDAILPGQTILEPSSGNTGISLAMICARKGYPLTVVMPENVTPERTAMLGVYGADVVYSPGHRGCAGAVELALAMAAEDPAFFVPYQYGNPANPLAHYHGTAGEILRDLGEVAAFVAGLGTGGTLMGAGRRLREELGPNVKIVAAELMPGESDRSLQRRSIPPILDLSLLDRKVFVSVRDAIVWTRRLLDDEGIFAGVSSGAIASEAVRIAGELDGGNVVFMVCDDGWRYLSSGVHTRPLEEIAGVEETAWW